MPAKTPMYLKTGGRGGVGNKGSKKLREILSADMISPPLGDFRHTAHVGRGGTEDMFGDTSFLQKGTEGKGTNMDWSIVTKRASTDGSKRGSNLKTTSGKPCSHERSATLDRDKTGKSGRNPVTMADNISSINQTPVLQSAFSLPLLSSNESPSSANFQQEVSESSSQTQAETELKLHSQSGEDASLKRTSSRDKAPNGFAEGPPKPSRVNGRQEEKNTEGNYPDKGAHTQIPPDVTAMSSSETLGQEIKTTERIEDDTWKFDLDLGPSLMEEMMGIMEQSKGQS